MGAVSVAVREVLGATVGFLGPAREGAILGPVREVRGVVPRLDLGVLYCK